MATAVKTRSSTVWSGARILLSGEGPVKGFKLGLQPIWEDKGFE